VASYYPSFKPRPRSPPKDYPDPGGLLVPSGTVYRKFRPVVCQRTGRELPLRWSAWLTEQKALGGEYLIDCPVCSETHYVFIAPSEFFEKRSRSSELALAAVLK